MVLNFRVKQFEGWAKAEFLDVPKSLLGSFFTTIVFMSLIFALFSRLHANTYKPLTSEEVRLGKLLQINNRNPETKTREDSVKIEGSQATISIRKELPMNPDESSVECLGYRWLLGEGSNKMSNRSADVFKTFSKLQKISLEFTRMNTGTEKPATPKVYLKMTIDRKEIEKFRVDNESLKEQLREDEGSCVRLGHQLKLSEKKIQLK